MCRKACATCKRGMYLTASDVEMCNICENQEYWVPIKAEVEAKTKVEGRTYTREDIVRILDADIEANVRQWGADYIYTRWAREHKDSVLADYDAGKVVLVEKEPYHDHGMDFEREYYSDGTVKDACYGWTD